MEGNTANNNASGFKNVFILFKVLFCVFVLKGYDKPYNLVNTDDAGEQYGLGLTHRPAGKFPVGNPLKVFRDIILESGAPERLCSVRQTHDLEPAGGKCWTVFKRKKTSEFKTSSHGYGEYK